MNGRSFDVNVVRSVDVDLLTWPTGEERRSETLGGNRDYGGFDVPAWATVKRMIEEERAKVAKIGGAEDCEAAHDEWEDNGFDGGFLLGFDLGTNALSAALRGALCLPFYSCNGGAFGGLHNDAHPLVVAFCRPSVVPILLEAAAEADAGLINERGGCACAYARSVDGVLAFADALYARRSAVRELRRPPRQRVEKHLQRDLFDAP